MSTMPAMMDTNMMATNTMVMAPLTNSVPATNANGSTPAESSVSLAAPPPPISASQQQQLQQLLAQYMANKLTPAQYQEQRQAIIRGQ
jgi:hypothetical protein